MNAFPLFSARGVVAPAIPLLDSFPGATAAWSIARKLRAAYAGNAIRVIRTSDSTQTDIGFDGSGNLDSTALLAFASGGDCGVTKMYDQSVSGGHDASWLGSGSGPLIVTGGSLVTGFGDNSRPNINGSATISGSPAGFSFTAISASGANWSVFTTQSRFSATSASFRFLNALWNSAENVQGAGAATASGSGTLAISDGSKFATVTNSTTGNMLIESYKAASLFSMKIKSVSVLSPTAGSASTGTDTSWNRIGKQSANWQTRFAELVVYLSDQTANSSGIYANVNTYYGNV